MKLIDLTGQRFGMLTVVRRVPDPQKKKVLWECRCDCGNTCVRDSYQLRHGAFTSCGCMAYKALRKPMPLKYDLTGQRFGALTVMDVVHDGGKSFWRCRCECGKECLCTSSALRNGKVTSCGCGRYRIEKKIGQHYNVTRKKGYKLPRRGYAGKTFGRLTGIQSGSNGEWLWKCDCGGLLFASVDDVVNGKIKSCGCVPGDENRRIEAPAAATAPEYSNAREAPNADQAVAPSPNASPIARLRIARGLSQAKLAEKIGMGQANISLWECGKAQPSMKALVKLSEALQCSVSELRGLPPGTAPGYTDMRMAPRASNASPIARLRVERGLTQTQLANMIGTRCNAVSNWERGTVKTSKKYLLKLSEALQCDISEIVDFPKPKCKLCGNELPPQRKSYCSDACADEWKKRQKRVENPRKSPGGAMFIPRICQDCGSEYIGHIKSKRCPDCQADADRRANAEFKQRRAQGHTRMLGTTDFCEKCGDPYIVNGGKQRYCKACAEKALLENTRKHNREWNKAYYAEPENREMKNSSRRKDWQKERKCPVCGHEFMPESAPQKFCSDACRTINRRNQQKRAEEKRRGKKAGARRDKEDD